MKECPFKFKLDSYIHPSDLNTRSLFDKSYSEPLSSSAIDVFYEKTIELNKLIKKPEESTGALPNLVLLGYISAVESYFREIIRRLIIIDESSRLACESQTLTYGAVIVHEKPEMLPEALMENRSFANKKVIIDSLRELLGLKGSLPSEVEEVLEEFSKVCHLRHCIVHRFGKLGSNNAIKLGLMEHKECLEKPLTIDYRNFQEILLICNNTVKVVNNFLFQRILNRTADTSGCLWTWDFRKDKKDFKRYYDTFVSENHQVTMKAVYDGFRKACTNSSNKGSK